MLQYKNFPDITILIKKLSEEIISIDPDGCKDIDDAFSYKPIKDGISTIFIYLMFIIF